ncbi:MAG: tetratricopeptide repeat protein [Elusimicrobia bacterium]|nr:tetratricopeptide repeat protein [Elusimicrobiota bacterium]
MTSESRRWIAVSFGVFIGVEILLGVVVAKLLVGSFVSHVTALKLELILVLSSYFLGGYIVGYVSPSVRTWEPAVGAALAVAFTFLMGFFSPLCFFGLALRRAGVGAAIAFCLALAGARLGEKAAAKHLRTLALGLLAAAFSRQALAASPEADKAIPQDRAVAISSPALAVSPEADKEIPPSHAVPLSLSAEADKIILQGLDAAYGFDFERAASLFAAVSQGAPEHPAGPFFLASLHWLEFSQNADIPGTIDALEPKFNEVMDEAFSRAKKMHEKNRDDPEANFYLGAAYGMKGRWQLLKRQWIRAASNGYKGYKYLQRTIELYPGFYDAYLGLGMYDYYSDTLPTVLKFAANLIARGDKQRGLRYIDLTMAKGHYSVTEAKLFLVGVLAGYEKRPQRALEIVQELRHERPNNLFFIFMEVIARINSKDWFGAIAFGEFLIPRVREVPYTKPHVSLFDLYLGDAYLGAKDYDRALETLNRCIEQAPEPRKATVTYCRLRMAQAFDLLGRREEALKCYADVKRRPDFFDSQDKAKRGLKRPPTYDEVVAQFFE